MNSWECQIGFFKNEKIFFFKFFKIISRMLKLIFVTLFPSYFHEYFKISLAKKAVEKNFVSFQTYNIRNYSKNGKADDYPYGGGRGMLIKIEPLIGSLLDIYKKYNNPYVILLSPQGSVFQQKDVERLLKKREIVFICGHYEGFDTRINYYVDEQVSIGNFITMGGELPALLISESLIRAIPGFIHPDSYKNETFSQIKFDYDSYTRPVAFDGIEVPKVLISGNHKEIGEWRLQNSLEKQSSKLFKFIEKKEVPKIPNQGKIKN